MFLFQAVNYYSSTVYTAFLRGRFVGTPKRYYRLLGYRQEQAGVKISWLNRQTTYVNFYSGAQSEVSLLAELIRFDIKTNSFFFYSLLAVNFTVVCRKYLELKQNRSRAPVQHWRLVLCQLRNAFFSLAVARTQGCSVKNIVGLNFNLAYICSAFQKLMHITNVKAERSMVSLKLWWFAFSIII